MTCIDVITHEADFRLHPSVDDLIVAIETRTLRLHLVGLGEQPGLLHRAHQIRDTDLYLLLKCSRCNVTIAVSLYTSEDIQKIIEFVMHVTCSEHCFSWTGEVVDSGDVLLSQRIRITIGYQVYVVPASTADPHYAIFRLRRHEQSYLAQQIGLHWEVFNRIN